MRRVNAPFDWTDLIVDASCLWTDAAIVIALRSWRMMGGGPAAAREFERMLSEKVEAGVELAGAFTRGRVKSPEAATRELLGIYGKRVRRNLSRLSGWKRDRGG